MLKSQAPERALVQSSHIMRPARTYEPHRHSPAQRRRRGLLCRQLVAVAAAPRHRPAAAVSHLQTGLRKLAYCEPPCSSPAIE